MSAKYPKVTDFGLLGATDVTWSPWSAPESSGGVKAESFNVDIKDVTGTIIVPEFNVIESMFNIGDLTPTSPFKEKEKYMVGITPRFKDGEGEYGQFEVVFDDLSELNASPSPTPTPTSAAVPLTSTLVPAPGPTSNPTAQPSTAPQIPPGAPPAPTSAPTTSTTQSPAPVVTPAPTLVPAPTSTAAPTNTTVPPVVPVNTPATPAPGATAPANNQPTGTTTPANNPAGVPPVIPPANPTPVVPLAPWWARWWRRAALILGGMVLTGVIVKGILWYAGHTASPSTPPSASVVNHTDTNTLASLENKIAALTEIVSKQQLAAITNRMPMWGNSIGKTEIKDNKGLVMQQSTINVLTNASIHAAQSLADNLVSTLTSGTPILPPGCSNIIIVTVPPDKMNCSPWSPANGIVIKQGDYVRVIPPENRWDAHCIVTPIANVNVTLDGKPIEATPGRERRHENDAHNIHEYGVTLKPGATSAVLEVTFTKL